MQNRWKIWTVICLLTFNVYANVPSISSPKELILHLEQDIKKVKSLKDLQKIMGYFHPDVLIILENGRVFESAQSIEKYIKSPIYVNNFKVEKIRIKSFSIEKPIISLSDHSALIHGKISIEYHLSNSKNINFTDRWAATLINEKGTWRIRSYQVTSDIFNNPLIDNARYNFYFIIIITLIIGAILGLLWKKGRSPK